MKTFTVKIMVLVSVTALSFGQLKSDINESTIPDQLFNTNNSITPLFSPNRFSMNHSFSYSMLSTGAGSIGLGAYTNTMSFQIRPNLSLNTVLMITQSSLSSGMQQSGLSMNQVGYGAQLNFQPTEHSSFQISFMKTPYYPYSQYPSYSPYMTRSSSPLFLR